MVPKPNDKCFYKRKTKEDLRGEEREEGHVKMEAENLVIMG